jgi:hypothetical protein
MSPSQIKYFLLIYDIPAGKADVVEFGTEGEKAVSAYEEAEELHRDDPRYDVVLLGSDSLESVKVTHASYFGVADEHVNDVIGRELALL